jgi:hypothetical protein
MKNLIAATINFGPSNGSFSGPAKGIFAPGGSPQDNLEMLISTVVGVMTVIAGIWFIFIFLIGAVGIITSGGDKGAYETARKRITSGLVGLIIIVFSIAIISLIGKVLGFDILGIGTQIDNLRNR